MSMLRNATWTLSNFCRGKPQPDFAQVGRRASRRHCTRHPRCRSPARARFEARCAFPYLLPRQAPKGRLSQICAF